ncbi:selection and upkeep of intraepithelial T-cells protein 2, partial [Scomber scombrus]
SAPKPSVRILNQTLIRALLQCEVRGAFPKPELEWQGGANILPDEELKVTERGGLYDIILQTTVTKTDNYRCVATQKEISHQTYAGTFVYFSWVTICIIVVIVILAPGLTILLYKKSRKASLAQSRRQPSSPVSTRSGRSEQQAVREEEAVEMNARDEGTPSLEADLDLQLSAEKHS